MSERSRSLSFQALVERTIQLRKGTNEYRKREDTVYWEGQGAATALGHELTHGVRGPTPFKGRSDLTDKRRAQLEPGGRFDEREVVQQGENPMRFEAGEPLRTGTHTGMPMVNDWSQLANPSSLLQPSKPKWCGEFKGYVP